jgi:hypothetical protein
VDSEPKPEPAGYCDTADRQAPAASPSVPAVPGRAVADCVLCGEPSEHPAEVSGAPLCPLCEWQQAQRGACSG